MIFDSVVLSAVAAELNNALAGGKVGDVYQPVPMDVVITIRNNGANYNLLISADPETSRVHLTSIKRPNPKTPPNFCMLLRKYLEGARFTIAEQDGLERILNIRFTTYDGERITLACEIMGKHSNIVLMNDILKILGVVKPVGHSKNRFREILTGRQYVLPPAQSKADPFAVTGDEFNALFTESFPEPQQPGVDAISSWVVRTFAGFSPFAAKEIVLRAEGDPARLSDEFEQLIGDIKAHDFMPVLISNDGGNTIGFYSFPTVQYPESNQFERASISAVADVYYSSSLPKAALSLAKDTFITRLNKEIDSRERTIAFIQDSLRECENADRYKQIAELILSQSSIIPLEASSVLLVDYYDPEGKSIEVQLDPRLNQAENAESYFKKFQKAVAGAESLKERLANNKSEISILRNILIETESVTDTEDVKKLSDKLESQGITFHKQDETVTEKKKAEFDGHRITRYTSGVYEILVGMNSLANDYLVTRIAKPSDIWLHVKAAPSAHVLIRTNNKPESVPQSVIGYAAELAAKNSDSKHSSLVPVDYTLRKYVRKPKGAPAGKAIYQNEKTLYITPKLNS
ncbi:MAG: Rqc2 family fibronectin-binding protein [Armatimonadota bacterium]